MRKTFDRLRAEQLDRMFRELEPLRTVRPPPGGWLKAIRQALGMTVQQAADRIGVTKSMISKYERAEVEETITLATLRKAARALDSDVLIAVVPERPIRELLEEAARRAARRRLEAVHESMALEDQATSEDERERLIDELAEELLRERPRELWDRRGG